MVGIWLVWIESFSAPVFAVFVFRMFWVGHGVEEIFVAGNSANILRQAPLDCA